MLKRETFWGWLIIFFPASIGLVLHGYLGSFTRLMADDYCSAYIAHRLGFLRSIWFWYRGWSGGYSTSVLDYLLEILGRYSLPFLVPMFLGIWFVAVILAVMSLLPSQMEKTDRVMNSLALGAIALFTILLLSPNVPQSLYWWVGMRAYSLPLIFLTFYIFLYQFFKRSVQGPLTYLMYYLLSFALIFFNSGFSETYTPVQVVLFIEVLILGIWTRHLNWRSPAFRFLLAGLFGAILGLVVMVASPGNAVRQGYFPEPPTFFNILVIAVNSFFSFLSWLFSAYERILGLFVSVLSGIWIGTQIVSKIKISIWMPSVIFLNGLVYVFGCFIPAAYGLSESAPDRALIIAIFFLVANFIAGGVLFGMLLFQKFSERNWLKPVIMFLLAISFWPIAWMSIDSLYDSRQVYIVYAQQWDAMDAQILAAKQDGQTEVHIPGKQNWAGLFEPNDNPKFWPTMCISKYYDIQVFGSTPGFP